jgi:hypothetical protein
MSFVDRLTEVGRDLTKIEVNTIFKDGMTGRKMPWFPHALIDTAQTYVDALERMGVPQAGLEALLALPEPVREAGREEDRQDIHPKRQDVLAGRATVDTPFVALDNGWDTFDKIRWVADLMLGRIEQARARKAPPAYRLAPGDTSLLRRIRGNCDQIKAILERLRVDPAWQPFLWDEPSAPVAQQRQTGKGKNRYGVISAEGPTKDLPRLDGEDATRIRKIWEIGSEHIVAQTLIQIDGDVITRIQDGLSDQQIQSVILLQKAGVDTGVGYWKTLLDVAERLIDGLATKLFR